MSRKGSSGLSSGGGSFASLGLEVEDGLDPEMFRGYRSGYGNYAYQLAQDVDEWADEDHTIVSYSEGGNKAYAVLSLYDDESLDAIISTGGGTGTKLLSKVMQYQQGQGKGLYWMVDNRNSKRYYDSMGLDKFTTDSHGIHYEIKPSQMTEAIGLVNKRIRK